MSRIFIFFAFVMLGSMAFAQSAEKMYAEKSGKIIYQYEISGEITDFILMYDDYGKRQAMDIVTKIDGIKERVKTIVTADYMYFVNYADKQVIKIPVSMDDDDTSDMFGGQNQGIDVEAIVEEVTGGGGKVLKNESVLGFDCKVFEQTEGESKGKFWIHNSYLLKAEYMDESGVHTYMEAKEFKVGVAVPAAEFEVPAGFTVTDMKDMMQQMQQYQQMYGVPEEE